MTDGTHRNDNRKQKGAAAEEAAYQYLLSQGYLLKDRNWRCRSGELDLVMEYDDWLIFIEVRSRGSNVRYGTAAESVDMRKIRQVRGTAEVYLHYKQTKNKNIRFDFIAVQFNADLTIASLEHIENAF
ncbi:YraN family protein [Paenibacillus pini]|uniref:UPF0102 protein JCM16418_3821 n=1 Tax=Paenibacillus pini JCM 16418 TaxID=1236976 RepID=W7YMJ1_9BACL|nr:YraN family protein [Paenibacillus pini]GAF09667.1 hypothetical protein JCM16418_3821 [Paenibacillus pini JCM 16418]